MKPITPVLLSFCIGSAAQAQDDTTMTSVEVMPEFPGGEQALFQFLADTVEYPIEAAQEGVTGTTYVTFVVEHDGSIEHAKVVKGFDTRCDSAALRAIFAMPDWSPGMSDGEPVRVKYNLPVKFDLPPPPAKK